MSERSDWDELRRVWQDPAGVELPEIRSLLKRRTAAIWVLTLLDAFFSLAVAVGAVWLLRNDPTPTEAGLAAFVLAGLAVGWPWVLAIRRGTWRADVAAPAAMVELSMRRCRASIQLALFNKYAVLGALAIGWGLRASGVRFSDMGFEGTGWMRLGATVFMLGWAGVAEWYKRRKRTELSRLQALHEQLEP